MDVGRPEEHLPVQRDLDGRDAGEAIERGHPLPHVAETFRPAEEVFPRRFRSLVYEDGVTNRANHLREAHGPRDEEVVHEVTRVPEETEPGDDVDRLLPGEPFEVLPDRLGAQADGGGEAIDRPARGINQRVEHPPIESRERPRPLGAGDTPPARFAAEEPREGPDGALDVPRPELDRDAAVHLPGDPCDLRRVERLRGVLAPPLPTRGQEEVRPPEDRGVDRDPVPLEDAALLEAMEPLADRGRGQADPPSERLQALPRVLVERDEQAEVLRIHGAPKARRP